jgi:hypothetical protein
LQRRPLHTRTSDPVVSGLDGAPRRRRGVDKGLGADDWAPGQGRTRLTQEVSKVAIGFRDGQLLRVGRRATVTQHCDRGRKNLYG